MVAAFFGFSEDRAIRDRGGGNARAPRAISTSIRSLACPSRVNLGAGLTLWVVPGQQAVVSGTQDSTDPSSTRQSGWRGSDGFLPVRRNSLSS